VTRARRLVAWLLVTVAVGALTLAAVAGWVRREFLDAGRVAAGVRAALDDPAVHDRLVAEITSRIAGRLPPEADAVRPLVTQAVDDLVATERFGDAFEAAVAALHADLLAADGDRQVRLDLTAVGPQVEAAVVSVDPRLAPFVDTSDLRAVELGDAGRELPDLAGARSRLDGLVVGGGAIAAMALALALIVAPSLPRLLIGVGLVGAISAIAVALLSVPIDAMAVSAIDDAEARALVEAFLDPSMDRLRTGATVVVATGAALAVAVALWARRPRAALMR